MRNIARFAVDVLLYAFTGGSRLYYIWLGFLGFLVLMMIYGSYQQTMHGMIVTNYNDQVSWGIYEAQFIFLVGVAAAAVTVIFPAYVYKHKYLKGLVIIGELLAISAIYMVLLFIMLHMGRPDRLWHMFPVVGIFNFPNSMLAWDVMVVNGYFFLNVIGASYYLYTKYQGRELNKTFYTPLVYISIVWAVSIHTCTAFLISTLPARPMWYHAIMPIKFISTAFAAGPSMIIIAFLIIRKVTRLKIEDKAIDMLSQIIGWSLTIAIFLTFSEVVTELYHVTEHSFSLQYLVLGHEGFTGLVAWFKAASILLLFSFVVFIIPKLRKSRTTWLPIACVATFVGIWIDKGMGLVVPAFIPSPIGEFTEYTPSMLEIINVIGVWATGLFLFTVMVRAAIGVSSGEVRRQPTEMWNLKGQVRNRGKAGPEHFVIAAILLSGALFALPSVAEAREKHVVETVDVTAPEPSECFESREVYSTRQRRDIAPGVSNIKCSKATGAVLWFGD
ncbi:MAG: NrfD/PsrC family molybdoenzyme membrane anchor subunit, partial [Thermodesulfobacteriota bacterium]